MAKTPKNNTVQSSAMSKLAELQAKQAAFAAQMAEMQKLETEIAEAKKARNEELAEKIKALPESLGVDNLEQLANMIRIVIKNGNLDIAERTIGDGVRKERVSLSLERFKSYVLRRNKGEVASKLNEEFNLSGSAIHTRLANHYQSSSGDIAPGKDITKLLAKIDADITAEKVESEAGA